MIRFWTIVGFLLVTSHFAQADDNTYQTILRDSRIVRNTAKWDFGQIRPAATQCWLVVKVTAGPTSGFVQGIERDVIGKAVNPPFGTKVVMVVDGTLKTAAILSENPKEMTSYQWEVPGYWDGGGISVPMPVSNRNIDAVMENAFYSPFIKSGTVICAVNKDAEGENKFSPVYLIPSEWQNFAVPALQYTRENESLFRTWFPARDLKALEEDRTKLRNLVENENAFVAIEAARTLAYVGELDKSFVEGTFSHADGFKQAVFTYLLLTAPKEAETKVIEEIAKLIDKSVSSAELQWIALGSYAAPGPASNFSIKDTKNLPPVFQNSLDLLKRINKKQASFKTDSAADKYISSILVTAGLRENKRE